MRFSYSDQEISFLPTLESHYPCQLPPTLESHYPCYLIRVLGLAEASKHSIIQGILIGCPQIGIPGYSGNHEIPT